MKVLIVNYYYQPMVDAHAYRWTQLAEYWADKGHEVDVICSKVKGAKDVETSSGVNITRVGFLRAKEIQSETIFAQNDKLRLSLLLSHAKDLARKIYRKVYWPDGLWHWFFAVSFELLKKQKKYDLIVSYSPSFSAHVSLFLYKKIFKTRSFWIADYGDPFSTSVSMPNNNYLLYDRFNHAVERAVLGSASRVFFTSNNTLSEYISKFGFQENLQVLPHLVDIDKTYLGGKLKSCYKRKTINMVFVGNFHLNIREPYLAVKILCALAEKIRMKDGLELVFDIYGASNGIDISSLSSSAIRWHGPLHRDRVREIMQKADFLVNIENSNCSMIPSKVVEYIGTGKPIINIAHSDKDVSELMASYTRLGGAILLDDTSCDFPDRALEFIRENIMNNCFSLELINDFLTEHRIDNISDKYLSACNNA